jgi:3-oxoacyl-[acyl-carrier-protein] synthase III
MIPTDKSLEWALRVLGILNRHIANKKKELDELLERDKENGFDMSPETWVTCDEYKALTMTEMACRKAIAERWGKA